MHVPQLFSHSTASYLLLLLLLPPSFFLIISSSSPHLSCYSSSSLPSSPPLPSLSYHTGKNSNSSGSSESSTGTVTSPEDHTALAAASWKKCLQDCTRYTAYSLSSPLLLPSSSFCILYPFPILPFLSLFCIYLLPFFYFMPFLLPFLSPLYLPSSSYVPITISLLLLPLHSISFFQCDVLRQCESGRSDRMHLKARSAAGHG